ncbi:gastric triacylglycerol lipase [Exaiptasia diaphana]|uniref:Lipase n=1 Tax=Exaiptasia diaphana TaxID=2652724 RepID=A0A913XU18_EXADI|nr:gastric triacylglycerol lipase [Exaiptasia diaphana]KXJ24655.1 Gastric triacylglycerol lipase [Exaiptasia diaphana]
MSYSTALSIYLALIVCVSAGKIKSFDYGNVKPLRLRHVLPEVNMNVSQMIQYNGYPVENHDVITKDGYILSIQRIPYGRHGRCKDVDSKPVIFLQHGLLCSSTNWVANLPDESFAFIAADSCFDVWLGNVRGNTYGKRHVKYPIHSDEFWDFSFDEMAKYDLPAMINYTLKTTGHETLYYAGHSQGTMIGFIEFSRNPDLIKKVKTFYALAPVSTVTYMGGAFKWLSYFTPEFEEFFKIFGIRDFFPSNEILRILSELICGHKVVRDVCSDILFLIAGVDTKQLNETRMPIYISHTPAGTSVKNMVHFAQLHKSKKFQMYDYGSVQKNKLHYGQGSPPEYNVSAVDVPSALYWGGKDVLADPRDVKSLMTKLPNQLYNKYLPPWNHLDFIWALDSGNLVYRDVIMHIKSQEKK